jgi:hypothetical protein
VSSGGVAAHPEFRGLTSAPRESRYRADRVPDSKSLFSITYSFDPLETAPNPSQKSEFSTRTRIRLAGPRPPLLSPARDRGLVVAVPTPGILDHSNLSNWRRVSPEVRLDPGGARRALSTIRVFNDPMTKFKPESFTVLTTMAWTSCTPTTAGRRSVLVLPTRSRIFPKTKRGTHKYWELECPPRSVRSLRRPLGCGAIRSRHATSWACAREPPQSEW